MDVDSLFFSINEMIKSFPLGKDENEVVALPFVIAVVLNQAISNRG